MKRITIVLVALSVVLLAATGSATTDQSIEVTRNLTSMPLAFTANHGQWDEQVSFRANAGGATMWFASDGAYYQFTRTIESDPISVVDKRYGMPDDVTLSGVEGLHRQPDSVETMMIKANFVGTIAGGVTVSVDPLAAGTYTANIAITAICADNSPRVVPVNYTVTASDNDPPIITFGPDSSMSTAYSNNITWQTNEPATSQVEYGLTAAYGNLWPLGQTLVTAHSVSLTGLTSETVYHFRVISRDASNNVAMSQDSTFETPVQSDNLALGRPTTVSGTFEGYSSSVICDGVIDPYGGTTTTWASDESADHWVEIDLQQAVPVSGVRICWALRGYSSKWMRSQFLTIQGWDGNSWSDLATIDNVVSEVINYPDTVITYDPETGDSDGFFVDWAPPSDDITISAAGFNTITLSRIRILQQGSMGPASYPLIMWLTEIEIYTDDITPPSGW